MHSHYSEDLSLYLERFATLRDQDALFFRGVDLLFQSRY